MLISNKVTFYFESFFRPPTTEGVDTLAQELAKLQDNGQRRIAFLGSRHVPVVDIHLIELIARSLAEEGHNILTSGSQELMQQLLELFWKLIRLY